MVKGRTHPAGGIEFAEQGNGQQEGRGTGNMMEAAMMERSCWKSGTIWSGSELLDVFGKIAGYANGIGADGSWVEKKVLELRVQLESIEDR